MPRVKMSRTPRVVIFLLRVYLIALLALLVIRFTRLGH